MAQWLTRAMPNWPGSKSADGFLEPSSAGNRLVRLGGAWFAPLLSVTLITVAAALDATPTVVLGSVLTSDAAGDYSWERSLKSIAGK